jgi:hypothetical protein
MQLTVSDSLMYSRAVRPIELERTFQHPNQASLTYFTSTRNTNCCQGQNKKISPVAGAAETDILNFL